MRLSFIIITWNGLHLLKGLLDSIQTYINSEDCEVLVVDNGSNDGTDDAIRHDYPHVKLFCLPRNMGVAYARNHALKQATGDYLFIIDNDMTLNDKAVEGMYMFMQENRDVGVCGCKLIDEQGIVQPSAKRYPGLKEKIKNMAHPGAYHYSYGLPEPEGIVEPDYLIGACQMVRREAFEDVGMLDQSIFYGPEDADFCIRIKNKGWRVVFLPWFTVIHHCRRITNRRWLSPIGRKHIRGLIHFYWKHKRII